MDKSTALHVASRNNHHQCVEILIDAGADIEVFDNDTNTPLYLASRNNHRLCVELLIDGLRAIDLRNYNNRGFLPANGADISFSNVRTCISLALSAHSNHSASFSLHDIAFKNFGLSSCHPARDIMAAQAVLMNGSGNGTCINPINSSLPIDYDSSRLNVFALQGKSKNILGGA